MRHQKAGNRLGRNSSHRKALMRNMATSLLDYERIETTEAKAKELRRYAEKMITLGKRGDLHARRQALSFIRKREVVAKIFDEYAERFKDRPGGYTRIMKMGRRTGDNARMAIIELIPGEKEKKKGKEKEKKKTTAAKPAKVVKGDKDKAKEKVKKEVKKKVKKEINKKAKETSKVKGKAEDKDKAASKKTERKADKKEEKK
ncbi:MAG: 50S ribosomal protein L17 [Deltaproteobacteria bacterium]|uniref:Large ribosomal subunit protein bL17 n=1 Tax=Candidatus Zymogenus saltonus TaxID=2844893 RepID=A0A9D8PMR8_9DELT|nr:50S ribosomal protein L17 [Candidatus Zymogenus saltonus]